MASTSATASCAILTFPLSVPESAEIENPVYWSDPPERVLQRLRELRGPKWWL
jgi:hypothetical protein